MKKERFDQKIYVLGLIIVMLAVLAHLTRFQNDLVITYNGSNLSAEGPQFIRPVSLRIEDAQFTTMSAAFRKSMSAEGGISAFSVSTDNGKLASEKRFVLYLFGHDIFGTMINGSYTGFKKTFGDWSRDNFRSTEVTLYSGTIPTHFSITASILGRGTHYLYLKNSNITVSVAFNDGRIDNTFSMCSSVGCNSIDQERVQPNLLRILNFFIEALLLASIILLVVAVLEKLFGEKNEK